MRIPRLLAFSLLAACSDYGLQDLLKEPDPEDSGIVDTGEPDTGESDTDAPVEECNGLDDDADGLVDEGFGDIDGDGLADCVDGDCEVYLASDGEVAVVEACLPYDPDEVADPWDLSLEWRFTTAGAIVVTPVTGQLTDDNADGVIDENDVPDIAFTSYSTGLLYIVSGDGGRLHCTASFRSDGGVIIADVTGDGVNEVVGPTSDNRVKAVDGACRTLWTSANTYSFMYPVTTAADLDGDGDVEVIADIAVVNGADGSHVATLAPSSSCWRTPIAADLDLDGRQEIILGDTVFDASGAVRFRMTGSGTSCFAAVANLDTDPQAEIIQSHGTTLRVWQHDGTAGASASLAVSNPGPPCAGDIDGDGLAEFIAPNGTRITAFENDGTVKWNASMQDSSGAAGCSVFDMNGDEVYEVIFADEVALRLYDGATGAVLYENRSHGSVTYFEYPTIADVDNDGSAEMIVVNSSGTWNGLTVFGHGGSGWPPAGPTWGIHDFAQTNQNSDGSIPTTPAPSWLVYNIFRGRPYSDIPGNPDLMVRVVDDCVSSCDPVTGIVRISYQVLNQGGVDTPTGFPVALYLYHGGVPVLQAVQGVGVVPAGRSLAGGQFDVPLSAFTDGGFLIVVDDDGAGTAVIDECDETNNNAIYGEVYCR